MTFPGKGISGKEMSRGIQLCWGNVIGGFCGGGGIWGMSEDVLGIIR